MNFVEFSLTNNALIFAGAAALVWFAGTKLTKFLDQIAEITGIGHAFIGLVFLGGITSLPELATVTTAALHDNAPLAVNNMLGSIAINIVFLAACDAFVGTRALTSVVAHSSTLLQATLNILLLSFVAVGAIAGNQLVYFKVDLWSMFLLPLFAMSLYLLAKYRHRTPWVLKEKKREKEQPKKDGDGKTPFEKYGNSIKKPVLLTLLASVGVLAGGYLLASSADAIAQQTGFSASLIGLVLVGFATGLPEISSIYAAVKLGRSEMAVGDIFGTNLWNVLFVGYADLVYRKGSVFAQTGKFEAVAVLLGVVLTCIYSIGFLERRDKTFVRMGYDSVAVVVVYLGGLVLLYSISS